MHPPKEHTPLTPESITLFEKEIASLSDPALLMRAINNFMARIDEVHAGSTPDAANVSTNFGI